MISRLDNKCYKSTNPPRDDYLNFSWHLCYPGGRGRACLRDAMMYMFCLRAHRFICIIFFGLRSFQKNINHPVINLIEKNC